ncbi:MAG: type II toxin-antitoxin system HicA family toxin [Deltaproteobacteria bacterium]
MSRWPADKIGTKLLQVVRQKGSHVSLHKGSFKTVVPMHAELAKGTLLGILKQCGLSKEDLISLISR